MWLIVADRLVNLKRFSEIRSVQENGRIGIYGIGPTGNTKLYEAEDQKAGDKAIARIGKLMKAREL